MSCFAHTLENRPSSEWEPLFTPFGSGREECQGAACKKCATPAPYHGHLNKVAWWCAKFGKEMIPRESNDTQSLLSWCYLIGLWHDLGKFAPEWQAYLRRKAGLNLESEEATGIVDHSTAGAN